MVGSDNVMFSKLEMLRLLTYLDRNKLNIPFAPSLTNSLKGYFCVYLLCPIHIERRGSCKGPERTVTSVTHKVDFPVTKKKNCIPERGNESDHTSLH